MGGLPYAPHPLEFAGGGVDDDDAAVPVAIGDIRFIRGIVHTHLGGVVEVDRIGVALARAILANLQQELPSRVNFKTVFPLLPASHTLSFPSTVIPCMDRGHS